jgi:hypothetical protein
MHLGIGRQQFTCVLPIKSNRRFLSPGASRLSPRCFPSALAILDMDDHDLAEPMNTQFGVQFACK